MKGFKKARCFLEVGNVVTSLATVSPQWDCVRCIVSHVGYFRVRHKVPHILVPAVRSTRSCYAAACLRHIWCHHGSARARRTPRSIAGVDTRTKEGKRG